MRHSNRLLFFKQKYQNLNIVGAELGVAKGIFSFDLLNECKNLKLYSIDAWAGDRGHDNNEYQFAKNKLSVFQDRSVIIKNYFHNIVDSFIDNHFDFIYIDGYAHTGQNNGSTLYDWYSKVKNGGIFSGHDYDKRWPKTINTVNDFIHKFNLKLNLIQDSPYSSWYVIKGDQ
jgi:hypothetical protein